MAGVRLPSAPRLMAENASPSMHLLFIRAEDLEEKRRQCIGHSEALSSCLIIFRFLPDTHGK
ncbi:MAG: hypothetical protein A2176_00535 [Spirochaetes bacterium RBG_13_51_14]|nr:MAG: hypothetical protein A2176_00535 [Spirochaetes bacterium RBG_13_51_14]